MIWKKMIVLSVVLTAAGSTLSTTSSRALTRAADGASELQGGSPEGKVIVGPAAASLARVLMSDRRMHRGRKFFSRRFELDLDDAVVIVGNKGERAVFVPFTDGIGVREAYLLHTRKGNKEKVTAFVLYFGQGQAYTNREKATIVKAHYSGFQDELLVMPEVEVAYTIYDYDNMGYDDISGEIVFSDGYGEIVVSESAASGVKRILKCSLKLCAGGAVGCIFAGPGYLKCLAVACVGGTAYCTLDQFF